MKALPKGWTVDDLGSLVNFKTGKLNSNAAVPKGAYPFFTCSQETFRTNTFAFDTECVLLAGNNANGIYPLKYFHGRFDAYQRTYVITPKDRAHLNARFLYYSMRPLLEHLKSISTGAATKFLTLTILNGLRLSFPSEAHQRKIASILSAYDDLIENNTHRIAILEAMAQAVYRDWFVEFRFPGHEKVKFVDSPLGKVPEGWKVATVQTFLDHSTTGIAPSEFPDEDFAHYSIPNYDTGKLPELEKGATIQSNKFAVPADCVLISKLNPRICRIWLPVLDSAYRAIASTEFLVMSPLRPITKEFVYCLFHSEEFYGLFSRCSSGTSTSHQRVKPTDFAKMNARLPTKTLIGQFTIYVAPMLRLVHNRRMQNENLRTTRDLLLPKLISGQLDVEALDIEISERLVEAGA